MEMFKKEGTPWNLAVAAIYPVEVDISPFPWLFSEDLRILPLIFKIKGGMHHGRTI